ncbi:formylglycine-generating enzyme family protein [Streptomyces sp. N2-109]|uniref:Formylglycine-generating enzyme family protein n=1 Tax=Streptomyces gossypii TaxID=2883101 RepID=A0ABT2JVR0_9ACTN|nr:formylglycine-generating enzyme family protein [Streptomyces gossypii]MCT2591950.1 formylglycine-generating enzyme family protein [Streptomyces gossypii]
MTATPPPTGPDAQPPRACCAPARTAAAPGDAGTGSLGGGSSGGSGAGACTGTGTGSRTSAAAAPYGGWRQLAGGPFLRGCADSPYPADGEGPVRQERLAPFGIAATAVSNAEFAHFARETGHRSDAERFGWSFVFEGFLPDGFPPTRAAVGTPWWRQVFGADWAHPEGPGSDVHGRADHPVVHVSYEDALAYCAWAGARLPSEAEWEYAARGGLAGMPYPWGREREPDGAYRMNIWRGSFPGRNTAADGYRGTCPVDAFPPNGYGLFNTTGNVWEWCADRFGGAAADPGDIRQSDPRRALRGGSYLCHESYCLRYRTSARMGNTPDSSSGNTGFRVAR